MSPSMELSILHTQPLDLPNTPKLHTHLIKFPYNECRVIEGSDLLIAMSIYNGHSLQAHGLHGGLWGEKESMVEVVEELLTGRMREGGRERERERN